MQVFALGRDLNGERESETGSGAQPLLYHQAHYHCVPLEFSPAGEPRGRQYVRDFLFLMSWGIYIPTPVSFWLRRPPGHVNSLALLSTQARVGS